MENIKTTLQNLFVFGSKSVRRKAFIVAMNGSDLSEEQKVELKQEYLIRESTVAKKKTEKMSVNDFEMLKVLGKNIELVCAYSKRSRWFWRRSFDKGKNNWRNICHEVTRKISHH